MIYCCSLMTIHTTPNSDLENFSPENDHLDTYLHSRMAVSYPTAWTVFIMVLILSHVQATVKRGFSVNEELLAENRKEQTWLQGEK